jgi:glycine/D-amino acid oxidase-like deaminating enzyme
LSQLSHERAWAGFRAATPDKLPYLGPTDDPTVLLAMGFEGLGITTAPAAARLLLDHLLDRASAIDRTPFLPERISFSSAFRAQTPLTFSSRSPS